MYVSVCQCDECFVVLFGMKAVSDYARSLLWVERRGERMPGNWEQTSFLLSYSSPTPRFLFSSFFSRSRDPLTDIPFMALLRHVIAEGIPDNKLHMMLSVSIQVSLRIVYSRLSDSVNCNKWLCTCYVASNSYSLESTYHLSALQCNAMRTTYTEQCESIIV